MKGTRHSEEEIIAILKQGEAGLATAELCRQHGITEQIYFRWKAKYGGMDSLASAGSVADSFDRHRLKYHDRLLSAKMLVRGNDVDVMVEGSTGDLPKRRTRPGVIAIQIDLPCLLCRVEQYRSFA